MDANPPLTAWMKAARVLVIGLVSFAWSGAAVAGGTPATNGGASSAQKLLTPAGSATTLADGEYVTNTAGLNSYYSLFVEVSPSTPRLRLQRFSETAGVCSPEVDHAEFGRLEGRA